MFRQLYTKGPGVATDEGQLLAPELFHALQKAFGKVKISHRGEAAVSYVEHSFEGTRTRYRSLGEIYIFCCPFCGDTRFRCWVSHLYGQPDQTTGRPMMRVWGCFNESCNRNEGRNDDFHLLLIGGAHVAHDRIWPELSSNGKSVRHIATPPGTIIPLAELGPRHQAKIYIADRGFDPDELSASYSVGYCIDADDEFAPALNRLYIPVTYNGKLVGWQARALHEEAKKPYYNMLGFSIGDYLYNFDKASKGRCIVIVEGVFDAWSVGQEAMALFGKVITAKKREKLLSLAPKEPLIISMIDPKETEAFDAAIEILRPIFPGRVLPVRLPMTATQQECRRWPPGKQIDAGALQQDVIWAAIFAAGEVNEINVDDYL